MITSLLITLVLTVGATLLGGGDQIHVAEGFEKTIKKCSNEHERKKKALAQMESFRAKIEMHQAEISDTIEGYRKIDTDYYATPGDYEAVNAKIAAAWDRADTFFLDQVFAMKEIFTPEEWQECIAIQDKRMDKKTKNEKKTAAKAEKKLKKKEKKLGEVEQGATD